MRASRANEVDHLDALLLVAFGLGARCAVGHVCSAPLRRQHHLGHSIGVYAPHIAAHCAVQTALVALQPVLSRDDASLELKLNVREKKNFGG